jgi:hypothetical protein
LRLKNFSSGSTFSFICEAGTVGKMDRVIAFADGKVISKIEQSDGIVFVVEKA